MAVVLVCASAASIPGAVDTLKTTSGSPAALGGALAFPFAQTLIGSADGTPPFFGRLARPTAIVRRICAASSWARRGFAYQTNLAAADGGQRFLVAFVIGALAYAGVDALIDTAASLSGERTKMQTWRKYALGVALGGVVAGAIGWYFDTAQLQVVVKKFWAYADVNYRLSGRKLGDFIAYPIFNKYGAVNLGEVAGGVRLFSADSSPASSTGRSQRPCSRSISCCSPRCWNGR